ncbi:MAG: M23 family metallopeptidase [Pseudomonadales bacterium]|jgi:murein DD-endopeptidase MepM/ murein hydrolase activator NlpD|nr:M23 family metallopeptidase [Pseudomonadales bacterium]MDP4640649.1 M23 family metallopeptidase [Pseudomonadales bacterium]MDP4765720.1 M23 family metallopeptidase [Pseudomonadales bacterium]MDP4876455.1 M23 family metallopeptidase [Pseudomonadales bacterium]MDP4912416.1 M23 family metallopeptidase [Pseudomonadales bacterium]
MKFIIVDNRSGRSRAFSVNGILLGLTLVGLIGIPAAASYAAYRLGVGEAAMIGEMVGKWRQVLKDQDNEVKTARRDAEENLEASAVRLAKLQSRIVRLDALGERLTTIAKLDEGEFDFSQAPALGGPEADEPAAAYSVPDYMQLLAQLADDIENREQQLSVLETLLVDRKIQEDVFIAGRPVNKGWMSSRYGVRNDPINGRRAWHNGVDFAGPEGSDVVTVAAGIVVFAGTRSGYGEMVEINHGGGFSTRYGHHKELLVNVGDIVKKGQAVGLMGSSGRSTGPHVHFEVYKNGRVVDPSAYIHRASR